MLLLALEPFSTEDDNPGSDEVVASIKEYANVELVVDEEEGLIIAALVLDALSVPIAELYTPLVDCMPDVDVGVLLLVRVEPNEIELAELVFMLEEIKVVAIAGEAKLVAGEKGELELVDKAAEVAVLLIEPAKIDVELNDDAADVGESLIVLIEIERDEEVLEIAIIGSWVDDESEVDEVELDVVEKVLLSDTDWLDNTEDIVLVIEVVDAVPALEVKKVLVAEPSAVDIITSDEVAVEIVGALIETGEAVLLVVEEDVDESKLSGEMLLPVSIIVALPVVRDDDEESKIAFDVEDARLWP